MRCLIPLCVFGAFGPGLFAAETVTFNRQIAPIIYNNCSSCHRPGEAAPFSLLSYQDVVKKGRMIGAATSSRLMPPWKAEAGFPIRTGTNAASRIRTSR